MLKNLLLWNHCADFHETWYMASGTRAHHKLQKWWPWDDFDLFYGERGGSVVECRTPEREVGGSIPTAAMLCPWTRHFTPQMYWLITQEAVAPSRHDWKIVDWDVKPQHKQKTYFTARSNLVTWALLWEKVKTMDFSETVAAFVLKVGRCSQLDD